MEKAHTRGRPRGSKRHQLTNWATGNGQFTMGQLARSLDWSLRQADYTLGRAIAAGDIRAVGKVRTSNAKRPVALYQVPGMDDQRGTALADAVLTWGRT